MPIVGRTKFGESARRLCSPCCGIAVVSSCPKEAIDWEFALSDAGLWVGWVGWVGLVVWSEVFSVRFFTRTDYEIVFGY